MRFAILGDHPDGWAVARALLASGRHQLLVYQGSRTESEMRRDWPVLRVTSDVEEVLADPDIEAVIVAGKANERLDHLRRTLQSERHAFCVHAIDRKPDGAYEMNLLQGDYHRVVLPILPLTVCRAYDEFVDLVLSAGTISMVELECRSKGELLFEGEESSFGPHFPGWDLLRRLGGAITEVQAFAREEAVHRGEPVIVQGRYESGALFRASFLPAQSESRICVAVVGSEGETALERIDVKSEDWGRLVSRFEESVERLRVTPPAVPGAGPAADPNGGLSWLDEIRAAELDDAARRSIERRKAITLEYQEVNEDVGFKGTMTLIGCGLLWLVPMLLIMSVWLPQIGWLIVPVLLGFLLLQLLRWFAPTKPKSD